MRKGIFSPDQEAILVRAIGSAEEGNRGEVRVHVEPSCAREDPLDRAAELFAELGMSETAADTGILLYVATDDHRCAVVAGQGLHGAEDEGFWQRVADAIANGYGRNDPLAGFEMALLEIGELLRRAAPGADRAGNELPNRITSG